MAHPRLKYIGFIVCAGFVVYLAIAYGDVYADITAMGMAVLLIIGVGIMTYRQPDLESEEHDVEHD